jgi:hypothetical protein
MWMCVSEGRKIERTKSPKKSQIVAKLATEGLGNFLEIILENTPLSPAGTAVQRACQDGKAWITPEVT